MFSFFSSKEHRFSKALFDMLCKNDEHINYEEIIDWLQQEPPVSLDYSYSKSAFTRKPASLLEVLLKDSGRNLEKKQQVLELVLEKDNPLHNYQKKKNILQNNILDIYSNITYGIEKSPVFSKLKRTLVEHYERNYPIARLPEDIEIYETEDILEQISDFPNEERWRLLVDAKLQKNEQAWLDYEKREPGSMVSLRKAFDFMVTTLDAKLNASLIKNVYLRCRNHKKQYDGSPLDMHHTFGASSFGVSFENGNLTVRGLPELEENQKNDYNFCSGRVSGYTLATTLMDEKIEGKISQYKAELHDSTTALDKLKAIIRFIITLERMHVFPDANCRTFCVLLLNRELIKNQFSPVILEDPNRFDGYSVDEMVIEVLNGMHSFQEVLVGNTEHLGLSHHQIEQKLQTLEDPNLNETHQQLIAPLQQLDAQACGKRKAPGA